MKNGAAFFVVNTVTGTEYANTSLFMDTRREGGGREFIDFD